MTRKNKYTGEPLSPNTKPNKPDPTKHSNKHPLPYTQRQKTYPLACEVSKNDPSHPLHDIPDEQIKNPQAFPGTYAKTQTTHNLQQSQKNKATRKNALRKDADRNRELTHSLKEFAFLPSTKDPVEVQYRMKMYFDYLEHTGSFPLFEEVCYTIGYSTKTVNNWLMGRSHPSDLSNEVVDFLGNMKRFCQAMISRKAVEGEVNNAIYIFMSKNWYEMKDQTETVVQHTDSRTKRTNEEIIEILNADVVEI